LTDYLKKKKKKKGKKTVKEKEADASTVPAGQP